MTINFFVITNFVNKSKKHRPLSIVTIVLYVTIQPHCYRVRMSAMLKSTGGGSLWVKILAVLLGVDL